MALSLVAGVVLIGAPGSTDAKSKGTADFGYKVVKFDYTVKASMSGSRESSVCVEGVTQDIGGSVASTPATVAALNAGKGELHIERKGTRGFIDANDSFDFDLKGFRRLSTVCEGGTTAQSSTTDCAETITSEIGATGVIKGPVGDSVRITWQFAEQLNGGWAPNWFCGDAIRFESGKKCRSDSRTLEQMTRPTVRIPFTCSVSFTTTPPAGTGYDRYEAFTTLSGSVTLKTKPDDR